MDTKGLFLNEKLNLPLTIDFNELVDFLSSNREIKLVVVDAPLTYPDKNFRDAEIDLRKIGIRTLPLSLLRSMEGFIKRIKEVYKGEIIETFPDGIFKSLKFRGGRRLKKDREILFKEIKNFIDLSPIFFSTNKDFIDACLCALCGLFYIRGKVKVFGGREGVIYLPSLG